ncbi:MAG: ABC transporter permease [Burkholderiales bacterium]|nr:ABC transporter permease [Burkholderiales bacterium]
MPDKKLKLTELLSLSIRTFRTKPQRAFLTVLGMSIGIATVLLLVSLGYGLQYILIGKLMTTEDSLITMEISYPSESNILIKKPLLENIKTYEDVAEVSPIAEFPGEVNEDGGSGLLVDTNIVEPSYFRLSGLLPNIGISPSDKDKGLVISSQTLIPLNLSATEETLNKALNFKVFYQDDKNNTFEETNSIEPIKIRGIISDESMPPTTIIFANSLSQEPPFFRKVLVKAKNVEVLEVLRDRFLGEGFLVSARIDLVTQARKITNIITIILGVFGITALIVSSVGMFNTMLVGFLERIYEVGILKSLGATDYDVRNLFLVEASLMGFMGGLGGVLIGIGGGKLLNLIVSIISTKFGGDPIDLFLTPWWFVFVILSFSMVIGFLSGWWPAHRAAGLSPKEAFTKR